MKKKILIIEDDSFLRQIIAQKISHEGFDVAEALDGKEGLKVLKEEKPDLILLDLLLPEMDGFQFLVEFKKDVSLPKIPVIIFSNLGDKQDIEKGLELGAVDFLIKAHFTPEAIIEKIKSALNASD